MAERSSGIDVLQRELDAWSEAGRTARLWLRDDDAIADSAPLRQLLAIAGAAGIDPLIAAIPAQADPSLVRACSAVGVHLAVHGIAHSNHAPDGARKCELGGTRPAAQILADLETALSTLKKLAGSGLLPVLVPPWNRIAPEVAAGLADLGFTGLSQFGWRRTHPSLAGIVMINTHVDIIDWRGNRRTRPADILFFALANCLNELRENGAEEPIGILTHHLIHDDEAWCFLEDLGRLVANHSAAEWWTPADLWAGSGAD